VCAWGYVLLLTEPRCIPRCRCEEMAEFVRAPVLGRIYMKYHVIVFSYSTAMATYLLYFLPSEVAAPSFALSLFNNSNDFRLG